MADPRGLGGPWRRGRAAGGSCPQDATRRAVSKRTIRQRGRRSTVSWPSTRVADPRGPGRPVATWRSCRRELPQVNGTGTGSDRTQRRHGDGVAVAAIGDAACREQPDDSTPRPAAAVATIGTGTAAVATIEATRPAVNRLVALHWCCRSSRAWRPVATWPSCRRELPPRETAPRPGAIARNVGTATAWPWQRSHRGGRDNWRVLWAGRAVDVRICHCEFRWGEKRSLRIRTVPSHPGG